MDDVEREAYEILCRVNDQQIPAESVKRNNKIANEFKAKKAPLDLLPPSVFFGISRALAYGADKYGKQNWADERAPFSVYYAALLRHLLKWFDGEDIDPESGVSHLDHVGANYAILSHMIEKNNYIDDRISNKELYS